MKQMFKEGCYRFNTMFVVSGVSSRVVLEAFRACRDHEIRGGHYAFHRECSFLEMFEYN